MKNCTKCNESKPLEVFAVYNGKPWYWCKPCQCAYSKSHRARFPAKVKSQGKEYRLKYPDYSTKASLGWRAENQEKVKAVNRDAHAAKRASDPDWDRCRSIWQKYKITIERYESMFRAQNGVCAICSRLNLSGRRLAVDHDHATGKVRGLLCSRCNSAIGLARESLDVLKRTVRYLEKHETLTATGVI